MAEAHGKGPAWIAGTHGKVHHANDDQFPKQLAEAKHAGVAISQLDSPNAQALLRIAASQSGHPAPNRSGAGYLGRVRVQTQADGSLPRSMGQDQKWRWKANLPGQILLSHVLRLHLISIQQAQSHQSEQCPQEGNRGLELIHRPQIERVPDARRSSQSCENSFVTIVYENASER